VIKGELKMKLTLEFSKDEILTLQTDDGYVEYLKEVAQDMLNQIIESNKDGAIKKVTIERV
jgi:hypothetical protein